MDTDSARIDIVAGVLSVDRLFKRPNSFFYSHWRSTILARQQNFSSDEKSDRRNDYVQWRAHLLSASANVTRFKSINILDKTKKN